MIDELRLNKHINQMFVHYDGHKKSVGVGGQMFECTEYQGRTHFIKNKRVLPFVYENDNIYIQSKHGLIPVCLDVINFFKD